MKLMGLMFDYSLKLIDKELTLYSPRDCYQRIVKYLHPMPEIISLKICVYFLTYV